MEGPARCDTYEVYVDLVPIDSSHRSPLGPYAPPETAVEFATVKADAHAAADRPQSLSHALERRGVYPTHSTGRAIPESDQSRFRLRRRRGLIARLGRLVPPVLIVTAAFVAGVYYAQLL
jgi:hypothetical protein